MCQTDHNEWQVIPEANVWRQPDMFGDIRLDTQLLFEENIAYDAHQLLIEIFENYMQLIEVY